MPVQPDGTRSLAELDQVAWSTLQHAYGPATNVPEMIRALATAADPKSASDAEHKLWTSIMHQGQPTFATVEAIPFLLSLMMRHDSLASQALESWLTDFSRLFEVDYPAYVASAAAVFRGRGVLAEFLRDGKPDVRSEAAGLFGRMRDATPDVWQTLEESLQNEPDDFVASDLLYSMARVAATPELRKATFDLIEAWMDSPVPIRRCAAAFAWTALDSNAMTPYMSLLAILPDGLDTRSWWGIGAAQEIVARLAVHRNWLEDQQTFDKVLRLLLGLRGFRAGLVLTQVLQGLFPDGAKDVPRRASDLDPKTRRLLEELSRIPDMFVVVSGKAKIIQDAQGSLTQFLMPSDAVLLNKWLRGADRRDCVMPGLVSRVDAL